MCALKDEVDGRREDENRNRGEEKERSEAAAAAAGCWLASYAKS